VPGILGLLYPLKMELTGCPATWAWNYHSILHNIPEEHRSHLHHSVSIKSPAEFLVAGVAVLCEI